MTLIRFLPALALGACLAAGTAAAQGAPAVMTVFDEADTPDASLYDASAGAATGGDRLDLAPGSRLPLTSAAAFSGAVSGQLRYEHRDGGSWRMLVGAPGFAVLDLSGFDTLTVFLNAPLGVPGSELPRVRLEDADGDATAALVLATGAGFGVNAQRSGFRPGSPTDARFAVAYASSLPAAQGRPNYPEDLTLTFSDTVLDTSRAAIGVLAVPARFRITSAAGRQLDFTFRDVNGSGTLDAAGEAVEVLTPDVEGGATQRALWRIVNASPVPPLRPPGAGDVYLLAVDNGGVDGDAATWQRVRIARGAFGPFGAFDPARVRGVRIENGGPTAAVRTLWVDALRAVDAGPDPTGPPPPTDIDARTGRGDVVFRWAPVAGSSGTHVYRQSAPGEPFERITNRPTRTPDFADLAAEAGRGYVYIFRSVGGIGDTPGVDSAPVAVTVQGGGEDEFLDLVEQRSAAYFWTEANPANGLVRDRSQSTSAASIAAVGFGLSAIATGIDRGWISREAGRERVLTTLRFFWTAPQNASTSGATGHRGFFYHFLDMTTGRRAGQSELSTIDTALLLAGVLDARQYFAGADADETAIRAFADSIVNRVEWTWAAPRSPRVALGWSPEGGFIGFDWVGYNEAMLIYLLGLGSATHPLPDGAWAAWTAGYDWQTLYGFSFVTFPPLFGHQYSHAWVDFRGVRDDYMRGRNSDYFENSRRATLAQRAYSIDNPNNHPNYRADEWGLTASDVQGGYAARGAPPAQNDEGTIAPTAPGGSVPFAYDETRAVLRTMYRTYGPLLWGPYGFRDAYNVRQGWFATDFLGIDQGPFVLMIENARTGAVWARMRQDPDLQRGLLRAGFAPFVADEPGAESGGFALAASSPARGRSALRVALPEAAEARIRVFDLLGRTVATVPATPLAAGDTVLPLDVSGLASGVYVVRLDAGGRSASARLVVVR